MSMAKKATSANIAAAVLALATMGAWSLGGYVNENLAELPVKRVPGKPAADVGKQGKLFDVKSLFPVWVASNAKARPAEGDDSIETLFKNQPQQAEVQAAPPAAPAVPDYASLLGSHMRIDGIGEDGAFINGKFYHVGEAIPDFEYPVGNRQIVPRLAEVKARSVIVVHGAHRTEIKV